MNNRRELVNELFDAEEKIEKLRLCFLVLVELEKATKNVKKAEDLVSIAQQALVNANAEQEKALSKMAEYPDSIFADLDSKIADAKSILSSKVSRKSDIQDEINSTQKEIDDLQSQLKELGYEFSLNPPPPRPSPTYL